MAFKKLVVPSLTDLFVNELETMILSGKLSIGDKLPPERQLAKEMDVSLAVIHGGIAKLTALGFLEVVPRQGVFVADYIRRGDMNTLKEILEYSDDMLDIEALKPVIDFRRSIERMSIRQACMKRSEEALKKLSQLAERTSHCAEPDKLPELYFSLHHEIAIASGSLYYPLLIQTFKPLYITFYQRRLSEEPPFEEPFEALCHAIEKQDTAFAEALIEQSIDGWVTFLNKATKVS